MSSASAFASDNPCLSDTVETRLPETQAPPPTTESAPQRQSLNGHFTNKLESEDQEPNLERGHDIPGSEPEHELPPEQKPFSPTATTLYTLSYLIFFSIFGTLARLGVQALTFYPGSPVVTGLLWANVGGSLLMGFFLEDKSIFREEWGKPSTNPNNTSKAEESKRHTSVKKTIPLYIGLTTGFCGSFTSFSSFIRDVFLALSNDLFSPDLSDASPTSRNGGYSFMALVAVILITVSLSLSALIAGSHLALALNQLPIPHTLPFRLTRRIIDPLFAILGLGSWLGAVFLAIFPPTGHKAWRGEALFAIVFAPLGTLLRFYVSLWLNARIPSFPLGTFAVNIVGTIILAMCYDLQRVEVGVSVLVSCQVLQGVMDGFCGCATTVSTWVAELNGLKKRIDAYIYGAVSVGVALGFLVVITGSLRWTVGFIEPVCG
ncbi:CrcB-like protein-domain-containing protein [Aspergillus nidulans var. acristatus]